MKQNNQSIVIDFLSQPDSYAGGASFVKKIETHISVVFLVGDKVFKLKRAIKYSYLDFSTLELRRRYCEAEVAINRRTAPDLYKGVVAVKGDEAEGFHIGGEGDVVEWLVEMVRFEEDILFDHMGQAGKLSASMIGDLAESIAKFHMRAEPMAHVDVLQGLEETIRSNADSFSRFSAGILDPADIDALCHEQRTALLGEIGKKMVARCKEGRVRHCHGDLHLRNICLIDGQPTLFDAIEFNETFAHIDVFYDLSFLIMDLDHRELGHLANVVMNRYVDVTGDIGGLQCLPLFLSLRATIRAHVAATAAFQHSDADQSKRLANEARTYLVSAAQYLSPVNPRLIAIGGLSGSGKSLTAREIAAYVGAAPGARLIRSDIIRKQLAGADPLSRLPAEGYTPEMTGKTYEALYEQARTCLVQGQSVIVDAVFARPEERCTIAAIAHEMDVPFAGLWLDAPEDVRQARVSGRKFDASDANAAVVTMQQSYDLGIMNWKTIDSSDSKDVTAIKSREALGLSIGTDVLKGA